MSAVDRVAPLRAAIDALAEIDVASLSPDEFGELLEAFTKAHRSLDCLRHELYRLFDSGAVHKYLGYCSVNQWYKDRLHGSHGEVAGVMRTARKLHHTPNNVLSWRSGETGVEHLRVVLDCRTEANAAHFDDWEERLATTAGQLEFEDFRTFARAWKVAVDAEIGDVDGTDPSVESRSLQVSPTLDGAVAISGLLDAIGGTTFKTALDRIVAEFFDADWKAAKESLGHKPLEADLARTPTQRRADALVEMAIRAGATKPDAKRPRPLLSVVTGLEGLAAGLLELWEGTQLTPKQLARILQDADVERFIYDSESVPIRYNPKARFFTGTLRRAIEVRDRHCTGAGCNAPVDRCQADHIKPHAKGGLTSPCNGRLACASCNCSRPNRKFRDPKATSGPDAGRPPPRGDPPDPATGDLSADREAN